MCCSNEWASEQLIKLHESIWRHRMGPVCASTERTNSPMSCTMHNYYWACVCLWMSAEGRAKAIKLNCVQKTPEHFTAFRLIFLVEWIHRNLMKIERVAFPRDCRTVERVTFFFLMKITTILRVKKEKKMQRIQSHVLCTRVNVGNAVKTTTAIAFIVRLLSLYLTRYSHNVVHLISTLTFTEWLKMRT